MIEVQNLYKAYGAAKAVDGISLQVGQGEIYGLVGPDGAGKTTTIRLVCGALKPTQVTGKDPVVIRIADYDILRHTEQARAQIGYLPQRFSLYEELTVLENLRFLAEVRGLPAANWKPRCLEILSFVGLDEFSNRRAGQLSGGMKQKLGLAAALVHRPKILLLDEPTTGVDPVTRQDFWQLIIRLVADEGVALLVSTPYMDEAARCSRLGFMQKGRLIVEGTPAELRERLNERIVEVRGKPLPLLMVAARSDKDVEEAQMFGDRLHLRVHPGTAEAVCTRLAGQIPVMGGQVSRIRPIQPQLEDVFIALVEPQI